MGARSLRTRRPRSAACRSAAATSVVGEPGGDRHQLIVDLHADQRRDPQDGARRLRDRRKSSSKQVIEHLRHVRRFAAAFGGQHLFGEERVPVAPTQHPIHELGSRGRPEDPGDLGSHLRAREPGELDPLDQPRPLEVADGRQHPIVGSKILGPDGQHQQEPAFPDPPDEEPEKAQGGLVGPLEVLDRDHDRSRLLQAPRDPEEELEQAVPRDRPESRLPRRGSLDRRPSQARERRARAQRGRDPGSSRGGRAPSGARDRGTGPRRDRRASSPPESGKHLPMRTRARSRTRSSNSSSSRVFPMPASPPTTTREGRPSAARARAASRIPISAARAMNTGLESTATIAQIIRARVCPD